MTANDDDQITHLAYEQIRKEDAVLWIGAGFSLSGGYPNGSNLQKIIWKKLPEKDKTILDKHLSLADLAQEITRLHRGKNDFIINVLKDVFNVKPGNLTSHQQLSRIPHIKTIITTNYDRMVELAYGQNITTVFQDEHINSMTNKPVLFKMHGDLQVPSSIVIAKDDYAKLYSTNFEQSLLWSIAKERLATKSVIFLGYGMEDTNVEIILRKVNEVLGENRKPVFFVAPRLSTSKIYHLESLHIYYINSDGETFVRGLIQNIRQHIFSDNAKGFVSPQSFLQFCLYHNISVQIKPEGNQRFSVTNITSTDHANTQFQFGINNRTIAQQKLYDLFSGKAFDKVVMNNITGKDFSFSAGGINLVDDDESSYQLVFFKQPTKQGKIDILFDDGFELNNLLFHSYSSDKMVEIQAEIHGMIFTMKVPLPNPEKIVNISLKQDKFGSVKEGLEIVNFVIRFAQGQRYTVFLRDGDSAKFGFKKQETLLKESKFMMKYLDAMKEVENNYNIRFKSFSELSLGKYVVLQRLNRLRRDGRFNEALLENLFIDLDANPNALDIFRQVAEKEINFVSASQEISSFKIHGEEIALGYFKATYQKLYIVNEEPITNGATTLLELSTRNKRRIVEYTSNPLSDSETGE